MIRTSAQPKGAKDLRRFFQKLFARLRASSLVQDWLTEPSLGDEVPLQEVLSRRWRSRRRFAVSLAVFVGVVQLYQIYTGPPPAPPPPPSRTYNSLTLEIALGYLRGFPKEVAWLEVDADGSNIVIAFRDTRHLKVLTKGAADVGYEVTKRHVCAWAVDANKYPKPGWRAGDPDTTHLGLATAP